MPFLRICCIVLLLPACAAPEARKPEPPPAPARVQHIDTLGATRIRGKYLPFRLELGPDTMPPPLAQEQQRHTAWLRGFFQRLQAGKCLTLEDYARYCSVHSEDEGICYMTLCCDPTRPDPPGDCADQMRRRDLRKAEEPSLFLTMLKDKLLYRLAYREASSLRMTYVRSSWSITYQGSERGAAVYRVEDGAGGAVLMQINVFPGEQIYINRVADPEGFSLLEFTNKGNCL
jgi:hypothetical protein